MFLVMTGLSSHMFLDVFGEEWSFIDCVFDGFGMDWSFIKGFFGCFGEDWYCITLLCHLYENLTRLFICFWCFLTGVMGLSVRHEDVFGNGCHSSQVSWDCQLYI